MSFTKLMCFYLLITLIPLGSTIAQEYNYVYSTYSTAGGSAVLKNIPNWRINEKEILRTKIDELPIGVKEDLIKTADRALNTSWPLVRLSDYLEFRENGNRVNFEKLYFARRKKFSELCAGELVTRTGKYLPEIANGLWLIMEESTWVLPAHQGKDLPDPSKPILDLFSVETAAYLAWTRLLLGDELDNISPELTKRLDDELRKRIINPYLANNDYWWMGFNTRRKQNNWNIWINSNLLKVAVLAVDEESQRNSMIEKVIRSADRFLDTYPSDGGCDEGPAYWSAAGGALGEFVSLLTRISSGKLN